MSGQAGILGIIAYKATALYYAITLLYNNITQNEKLDKFLGNFKRVSHIRKRKQKMSET